MALPARIAEWAGTGTTYYVDQSTGSDSNTETQAQSESTPWATIQKAIGTYVLPGSGHVRILVKNGTYLKTTGGSATEGSVYFGGLGARTPSSSKVLHVMNYTGHSPVIRQATSGTTENVCVWFDDSSATYIRLRGFVIEGDGTVYGTGDAPAIRVDTGAADIEIDECEIRNMRATIKTQGIFTATVSRIHVYNCKVHDIYTPGHTDSLEHGIYFGKVTDCVIVNSAFYDNRNGFGIQFYDGGSGGGSGNIIAHCVCANNSKSGIVVDGAYTSFGIRNCIIYDNDEYAVNSRLTSTVTVSDTVSNSNGLAGSQGNGYQQSGSSALTLTNNVTGDPLFYNYTERDFHISANSSAIEIADPTYTPTLDFEGHTRDVSTPDSGVDEFLAETLLPDADIAEGGWTTAPLHSKLADSSDATIITATAS